MAGAVSRYSHGDLVCEEKDHKASNINVKHPTKWQRCCYRLQQHRAILAVLFAAFFFSLQTILVKALKGHVYSIEIAFFRFVIVICICVVSLIYFGINPLPSSWKEFKFHLLRSILGTVALCFLYFALHNMNVGDATAIMFGAPVFVGINARIFLKEPLHVFDIVLVFTTITGVLLISRPPFLFKSKSENVENNEFIGAVAAFTAMLLSSFALTVVRQLGLMKVNQNRTVFLHAIIGTIITAVVVTVTDNWTIPPCGYLSLYIIAIGILNTTSQIALTYAYIHEDAVYVSIIRSNEVIMSYLLEFVVFGVTPTLLSWVGAVLIVASSVTEVSLRKCWKMSNP